MNSTRREFLHGAAAVAIFGRKWQAGIRTFRPDYYAVRSSRKSFIFQIYPHMIFFPALFLSITVLSVNLIGDGLRDHLDPRMSRSM